MVIECQLISPVVAGPLASCPRDIRYSCQWSETFGSCNVGAEILLSLNSHIEQQDGGKCCFYWRSQGFVGKNGCSSICA